MFTFSIAVCVRVVLRKADCHHLFSAFFLESDLRTSSLGYALHGLGLKRKFSFSYFRENLFSLFAEKAYEKLRK
jgi:hypothetical protein